MTSPLPTNRRTTRRATSTPARTAASWSLLTLLALAGIAPAQQGARGLPGLPPPPFPDIVPVVLQPPGGADPQLSEELQRYQVQLEPPGPQRLFRLESEAQLQKRMMQEAREQTPPDRIVFPEEPVVSKQIYNPYTRNFTWPSLGTVVEPNYVCHRPLLFEQRNAERYGWDLGPGQPLLCAGLFVKDWLLLPYHVGTAPCRKYECSAGLCLPGDPVPLLLYPPELSVSGLATEAAAIAVLIAIFP